MLLLFLDVLVHGTEHDLHQASELFGSGRSGFKRGGPRLDLERGGLRRRIGLRVHDGFLQLATGTTADTAMLVGLFGPG